jgi:hypothetical protein
MLRTEQKKTANAEEQTFSHHFLLNNFSRSNGPVFLLKRRMTPRVGATATLEEPTVSSSRYLQHRMGPRMSKFGVDAKGEARIVNHMVKYYSLDTTSARWPISRAARYSPR